LFVKGAIEAILNSLCPGKRLQADDTQHELLADQKACQLKIDGQLLGYLGELSDAGLKHFGLRSPTTVAEVRFDLLAQIAKLIPQHMDQSPYPAIALDLNLIVEEAVRWSHVADTVRGSAGPFLEDMQYQETYRDTKTDGAGKKRLLFSVTLRSAERTLTSEEAEATRDQIVAACGKKHGAKLLG
jgi:phenylalanyl-tRNA synthetase beta chain